MLHEIFASLARIFCLVSVVAGILVGAYALYIVWVRRKVAHLPTPPYKSFFMAHGEELNLGDRHKHIHLVFIRWAERYGPVYYFTILHKVMINLNTPELAKLVLTDCRYGKAKLLYKLASSVHGIRFMGSGLATNTDHNDWKVKRHAINPAFHKSTFQRLTDVFNDAADRLIADLEKVAGSGELVSMLDQMHRTTLDVIGQAAFSEDILDVKDGNFIKAISLALKSMNLKFRNPLFEWLPWNKKVIEETQDYTMFIRQRARRMLEARIKDISDGFQTPQDILDVLVRSMIHHYSMEDLVDEVITMFVAGQETTANLMSFFIMELGRNVPLQNQVRDEIDSIVGDKRYISQDDVAKLTWTTASIKETLRMYPPTGATTRDSPDHVETLVGYKIPSNSTVMVNFFAVQYLSVKDGFTFLPQRFLTRSELQTTSKEVERDCHPDSVPKMYSQLAFSLGQRSCIGQNFAYLEAKILAAKLFQHFTFKLNPDETFKVENDGTFKPADGAKVFLFKR